MAALLAAKQKQRILEGGVPAGGEGVATTAELEGVAAPAALEERAAPHAPLSAEPLGAVPLAEPEAFEVGWRGACLA